MATLPFADLLVLDLTRHRAGPIAGRFFADWGAQVIKIEAPSDTSDSMGGERDGFDYQNLHRNKRSLSLNLKTTEGKSIFRNLAARADVVLESFRPSVKYRLGVDYDSLRQANPRIICGSISGFGQAGPYAGRPAVDQIILGKDRCAPARRLPISARGWFWSRRSSPRSITASARAKGNGFTPRCSNRCCRFWTFKWRAGCEPATCRDKPGMTTRR
jgi:hypothetical protein